MAVFELVKLTIIAHGADGLSTIKASMEGCSLLSPSYLLGSGTACGSSMSLSEAFILRREWGLLLVFWEVAGFELVKLTIIAPTDSLVPTFDK